MHYIISKKTNNIRIMFNLKVLDGFDITPKNKIKYDGIVVNRVVIVNRSFIEKIIKKKIKKKLELYLKLIIKIIEDEDSGEQYSEALNDLTRYKGIIAHKYQKYLDEKYLRTLLKKIEIVEHELKVKILNEQFKDDVYIDIKRR